MVRNEQTNCAVGLEYRCHCRLHPLRFLVCSIAGSIASSRPDHPCLGAHAQPRDWIVQQRLVSSPSALTPTLNFPIKSRHNLPCLARPCQHLHCCTTVRLSILFSPSPEPLFFRSEMSHYHCQHAPGSGLASLPTFAWHVPAWASNPVGLHSRVDACPLPRRPPVLPLSILSLYPE